MTDRADGTEMLRLAAKALGGRVTFRNFTSFTPSGALAARRVATLRVSFRGRRARFWTGTDFIGFDLDAASQAGLRCSINRERPIETVPSSHRAGPNGEYPVFVARGDGERVPEFLASPPVTRLLADVPLSADESVQSLAGFGMELTVAGGVERLLLALDRLSDVADRFHRPEDPESLSGLPRALQPIAPVIREWGLTDDVDREELVESAHPDALRRMVAVVDHHGERIAAYLRRLREPWPDAAFLVEALAQAAAEARQRLAALAPNDG